MRRGSFGRAPWPLVVVAGLVALAGLAMTFAGAGQTGLSADEATHASRLESFYLDGLYVRDSERVDADPQALPRNIYVYGPATARVMHSVNQALGYEGSGEVSWSAEAFVVRHYVIASMSVVAMLGVGGLGWLLVGGWRWGVISAGTLAAVPMWTGHAMFNLKDVPVATGFTLMTLALAGLVIAAGKSGRLRLWSVIATCVALILGIALMLGTRPAMWPAVAAATVATVVIMAIGRALDRWVLVGLLASLAVSYAVLWKLYPRAFRHPLGVVRDSVGQTTQFPNGVPPGRGYVFERIGIEWPILLLLLALVGTVVAIVVCLGSLKSDPRRAAAFAVVGVQAYVLMLAAIIMNANVYSGLRHMLFTVPALAVLATVGMAAALSIGGRGLRRLLFAGLMIAALVLPMIAQARLHPYQYGYGNFAAELTGALIEDDPWRVSYREYVEEVPPTIKLICPGSIPPPGIPISASNVTDCRDGWGPMQPHWLSYWHHARHDPDSPKFYVTLRARRFVPPNCHVVEKVTRMRHFERAVMSQLILCTEEPSR